MTTPLPVISDTGTPAAGLFAQFISAEGAIHAAIDALAVCEPRPKDYDPACHAEAVMQWASLVAALGNALLHVSTLAEHCHDHIQHAAIRK